MESAEDLPWNKLAPKLQDQRKGKSRVCEPLHEIKAHVWFVCVI